MIRLGCRDMGIRCSFVARGGRTDHVKKLLFDHALRRHNDLLQRSRISKADIIEKMDTFLSRK